MRKDKFVEKVLKERPDFINIGSFFFGENYDHVLSGFFCEFSGGGAYVWRFIYPLFDKFDCLSLLYSRRLEYPEGYIDFNKISKKFVADEFLARIKSFSFPKCQGVSVDDFCGLCEETPGFLEHERVLMSYGYAKAIIGEKELALESLKKSLEHLSGDSRLECEEILGLIDSDVDEAKKKIFSLESEMKKVIGL